MRRTQRTDLPLLAELLAIGDGAPSLEQKLERAAALRASDPDLARRLDAALFETLARQRTGLEAAQAAQHELRALLDRLTLPPWFPAVFLGPIETAAGPRAMVLHAGARRVVPLADDVDLWTLAVGEEVFLANEGVVVAARSPYGLPPYGETAFFERRTADGRLVLRWRDEHVVVAAADALRPASLEAGDRVRWDRAALMAFEKIGGSGGERFVLADVPDLPRSAVGGQDANLDLLVGALSATLVAPVEAALYGLTGRQSILMVGPPGCGKTIMAKVAAAELARMSGQRCRFAVVKPGEWESPWVGETQMNIANTFRALREVRDGFAVLFLDEIDAIGRIRGGAGNPHGDKFLTALLAELDGFAGRAGVAIVAATNRKTLIDPALLERLSDVEITVARPDRRGARAIFDVHLPPSLPYAEPREQVIETAVSRLFAPNADNLLAALTFRDGTTRRVTARDLMSGRTIAQVCRAARLRALLRHLRDGGRGIRVADVEEATDDAMDRLATSLDARNAHAHLADLPQDLDVVRVEPAARRTVRLHRYRHAG
jgi:proteasome-associated ATPase